MAKTDIHQLGRNEIAVFSFSGRDIWVVELSIDVADIDDLEFYCDAIGLPTRDVVIMTYVDQYTDI